MKKRKLDLLLACLICLSILGSSMFILFNSNNKHFIFYDNSAQNKEINASNGLQSLDSSSIYLNSSTAYRLFDSVSVEVNTSKFTGVNAALMQVKFSDGLIKQYAMEKTGLENYTYVFIPEYNASLGSANVSFILLDDTGTQLNAQTTIRTITILSNYFISLNKEEYFQGDIVYGEIMVSNFRSYTFAWNVTMVTSDNQSEQSTIFEIGNHLNYFNFEIDNRFENRNKEYYVKINMTDIISLKKVAAYLPFKVLNTPPEIVQSSVKLSTNPVKREEDCTISLNVTDVDAFTFSDNITVSLIIKTATGQSLTPIALISEGNWQFSKTFKIDKARPIGIYTLTIQAKDQYNGIGTYSTTLNVENNYPEIHDYWINGLSLDQQIAINYGSDMIFTFNVSDVENTIAYVTVSLLNEQDVWYNITKEYKNGMQFKVRTAELITGTWYVYISVTDVDGATTSITTDLNLGPKEIRIIPDEIGPILPWITLIIGILVGLLLGLVIAFSRLKLKKPIAEVKSKIKKIEKVNIPSSVKKTEELEPQKESQLEDASEKPVSKTEETRKIKRKLK